ncbi:hypothetical protein [Paenibacillus tengchongensis]|uniref:hypothetical protein n=1 Tax=Paenibacillus tengchongensis TaxID=2608684 RepID=UPI00124E8D86|nr:hypothetical protein [Paenibacillus tengchongensis]
MANNNNKSYSSSGGTGETPAESEELSAEDLAILAAGFNVLGDLFDFLALVKAREATKSTGGQVDTEPILFVRSKKKAAKRKSRLPR